MPLYTYQHPKNKKKTVTIIQKMTDVHEYVEDGVKWNRVFDAPNAKIDSLSTIDPFNKREFMEKTKNKKMTLGDMWDTSAELSKRREQKLGTKDPIKEKTKAAYSKKCKGAIHPQA